MIFLNREFNSPRVLEIKNSVFYAENTHNKRVLKTSKISTHAEVHVIAKYLKQKRIYDFKTPIKISGTIYVLRLGTKLENGYNIGLSKPCKDCMKYIKRYGIKKIIYTDGKNSIKILKNFS